MRVFGKWLGRLILGGLVLGMIGLAAFWIFAPGIAGKMHNNVIEHAPYPVSAEAQAFHDSMVVADWHADSLLWKRDLTKRGSFGQVDLPRLREGGVAVQVFTAVTKTPAGMNYDENSAEARDNITLLAFGQLWPIRTWHSILERALYQAEKLHGYAATEPHHLKVVTTRSELDEVLARRARGEQVVAGILGVEGAHPLKGKLENLDKLEDAGYRLIGLQHFFDNELGGSLHGVSNKGLTDFGREVVAEVEKRGMIIDVAHSSPQVIRDVLAMTHEPIVLSHSGIHAHCPVKRNLPDDLMRAIAATGGVIGMGYWAEVACDEITPKGIAKMIVAAVQAVGEDHVSLGSDFDGSVETAFDTSELPALTHALLAAGLSESQIRKVMGENMLRVLRARLP